MRCVVKNILPSIPLSDTESLISKLLDKNHVNPVVVSDILNALETCLYQNFFQFNTTISLIKANLLSPLRKKFLWMKLKVPYTNIHFLQRYVNGIVAFLRGISRQLNTFLKFINSSHSKVSSQWNRKKKTKLI